MLISALHGRITFNMHYETNGRIKQGIALYNDALHANLIDPVRDEAPFSGFVLLLQHTDDVQFQDGAEHEREEIADFADFWTWLDRDSSSLSRDDFLVELVARWEDQIGVGIQRAWALAHSKAQSSSLTAERELLPDSALTDEELADPN